MAAALGRADGSRVGARIGARHRVGRYALGCGRRARRASVAPSGRHLKTRRRRRVRRALPSSPPTRWCVRFRFRRCSTGAWTSFARASLVLQALPARVRPPPCPWRCCSVAPSGSETASSSCSSRRLARRGDAHGRDSGRAGGQDRGYRVRFDSRSVETREQRWSRRAYRTAATARPCWRRSKPSCSTSFHDGASTRTCASRSRRT